MRRRCAAKRLVWCGAGVLALVMAGGGADAPTDELRGNTGIEQLSPEPEPARWPLWLGLGIVGAAGLGMSAWRYFRRKPREIILPPDGWALNELAAVEALAAAGQAERYHTLVSNVVRQYLEMRFRLHASRQTTEEFLQSMGRSPHLSAQPQALLRDFLKRCDLAKFARAGFTPDECRATAEMARAFVHETASSSNGVARGG